MTTSPFDYMARTLTVPERAQQPARPDGATRTDAMLQLLRTGPQGARELAAAAGVKSAMVGALLKSRLRHGAVVRTVLRDGRVGYALATEYDPAVREAIVQAIQLLKHHGFRVQRPRVQGDDPCEH